MASSIYDLYSDLVKALKAIYPASESKAISDRIFEHYLHLSPGQRVISGKEPVNDNLISEINSAKRMLLQHVPLQYVIGKAFFMDMEFEVNPSVLIPRPETEELVSLIQDSIGDSTQSDHLHFLDIGTGSGCIPISLKKYFKDATVTAIDISVDALQVAAANAVKNQAEVSFIQTDILDSTTWNNLPHSDIIVSNPPYVTLSEKEQMLPNVLDYEPHTALFVKDDDPLVFYRAIIAYSKMKLNKNGSLWFEINEKFGEEIRKMALNQGFRDVIIIFDFHGKSRFLHCSKMES